MKADSLGISLQDMLFLIGIHERSGELVLESGNNIGTILFHKGSILQAFSPYSRAFGDLMVEQGMISEAELLETLRFQKKSEYVPLGGLLLKAGKVTFDIIETLVTAQIRQSMKEFQSWNNARLSFVDKDVRPYDRIGLRTHEFLSPETVKAAALFLAPEETQREPAAPAATSSLA